jgi:phosphatidylglycerol---prolipoprotein diacylglyceryl transferase
MLPILQLGPLALPVYPISLLVAFWVGLALSARAARRLGVDGDHIWNAGLYGLLATIIVGRLAHGIEFWPAYVMQPLDIVGLNVQAFLWGPGALAGLLVAALYVYRHKLPWAIVLDAAASGVLAGLIVANLGALLAGNGVGAPANLPWAVELWGVPRHPVQLYAALGEMITLTAVLRALRKPSRPGTAALLGLLGWGLTTWLVEPFRAESSTVVAGIRLWQVIGLGAALTVLWILRRRAAIGDPPHVVDPSS